MADDKSPESYQSDDDMNAPREEEGDEVSVRSSRVSPPKSGSHSVMPGSSTSHSPATNMQGTPFISDIPVRGPPQFSQAMMPSDMTTSQHPYVESTNIAVGAPPPLQSHGSMHMQDMIPSPHEPSRRTSLFNSPGTEFPGTPNPGLYSNSWQQSTTAPANTPMYAFNTAQPQPQTPSSFISQPSIPLNPPPYMGSSQYSSSLPHPNDLYRNNGVAQNPVTHGQGYQNYLTHDGRSMPSGGLKMEPLNRGPLH